ncbi:hypothetical protein F5Y11DRAFT_311411 [Daldinia sp. FL1419]|nr:hypothetical protein F5Y11DRAFT_311411 [Daldinia sp. FL1419]
MPPPLPIPSKAAIHALRGIALGASCAIGVIVEDRRRRISTLQAAVSNKEKLKSVKRYHGMAVPAPLQFDEATFTDGDQFQWHPVDNDMPKTHDGSHLPKPYPRRHLTEDDSPDTETQKSLKSSDASDSSSSTTTQAEALSAQLSHNQPHILNGTQWSARCAENGFDAYKTWGAYQTTIPTPMLKSRINKRAKAVTDVTMILASKDEERLNRALKKFLDASISCYSQQLDEDWIKVSIELSKQCHAKGRLEDAAKVLLSLVSVGPIEESQFYAHQPRPLISHYLRQVDENGRISKEALSTATRIFLATFKERPKIHSEELENFGKELITQNLMLDDFCVVHKIYWRVISIIQNPAEFIGWTIERLHEYRDHKSVLKYFLLNYSKTSPSDKSYNATVDCVISSVEALEGLKAEYVLDALYRMNRPGNGDLRTRWITKLLHAHWNRNHDFPTLKALFEAISSLELLSKVVHPQRVYRTMIELSVKAEEYDLARSYYKELLAKHPEMASDVASRGHITLSMAKAGDWDGVFDAFIEMQALRDGQEDEYDNAFILISKVFAETHPASEVRDFVSKYTSVLGVRMHRYLVTMVANKYGQCHDMPGFISWLQYCSEAGFAMDSSFCNSLLHNCRTKWAMPYNELRALYSTFKKFGVPVDDTTRRILSQAALRVGKTNRDGGVNRALSQNHITVDKLAYTGRTTNRRDIYEAMNQEMSNKKFSAAVSIYQRAIQFGMPSCPHCLRLAVLATLRNGSNGNGSTPALKLIEEAYKRAEDVSSAVSVFIKFQLDHFQAGTGEVLLRMRNLIAQFETMHIVVRPDVLTHMAMFCVRLGRYEKAVSLCNLAADKSGTDNLCFSRQCFRALLMSYPQLEDLEGMKKLIEDLFKSDFAADRSIYLYLKATTRLVKKMERNHIIDAIVDTLEYAKEEVARRREDTRAESQNIARETLRIMNEALADMRAPGNGKGE